MNKITLFKWIAASEGISYLVLLVIAMPMKYMFDKPWLVQQVGMLHGVLFVAYIVAVLMWRKELGFGFKGTVIALLLSLIPFGTFYAYRPKKQTLQASA